MNKLIKSIFENFDVDGITIPVEFLDYDGSSEVYITWQSTGEDPTLSGDDEPIASIFSLDMDIYTKGNYLKILKAVKTIMRANGFTWTGDGPDMYEKDTGYSHKTCSFEKENTII